MARYNPEQEKKEKEKIAPKLAKSQARQKEKEKKGHWVKISEFGNLIKFVKDE